MTRRYDLRAARRGRASALAAAVGALEGFPTRRRKDVPMKVRFILMALGALSATQLGACMLEEHGRGHRGCDQWGRYLCGSNDDCYEGTYCEADGLCHYSTSCYRSKDCPSGFVCDHRNTCVPTGS